MDKYALLVRLNPTYWATWGEELQAGRDFYVWYGIGRRKSSEIHKHLPIVVLGTQGLGVVAVGETTSGVEFRPDHDWAKSHPEDQEEALQPRDRVQLRMQRLAVAVGADSIETNPTLAPIPKRARESITWLTSEEHAAFVALIHAKNG